MMRTTADLIRCVGDALDRAPDFEDKELIRHEVRCLHARLLGYEKIARQAQELLREVDLTITTREKLAEALEELP